MIFKDYYKILGLESSKVTNEEIRVAYREQAKKYHPDIIGRNDFSEERFKDINEAYKVLSSIQPRRKYDRMWNSHIGRKRSKAGSERTKETFSGEFMQMFFGEGERSNLSKKINKEKLPIRGEDIETQIEISLFEAFSGMEKKIALRTVNGKMKNFTIKIPAGIQNGEKIRLLGQGKAGENGGRNGDLFVKVKLIGNKNMTLKGSDIYVNIFLAPWEAILGVKVDVQTIEKNISLIVPQGVQSGEKITIPNRGYKDGKGGRGSLIAEIKIMVPKKIMPEEKELYSKLAKISKFKPRDIYN